MTTEETLGYSMFKNEAVKFFANNPKEQIFIDSNEYFIGIKKDDQLVVYEFHGVIDNYSAHIALHKKENNEKGTIQ